jgi:hypothetical protein
MLPRLAPVRRGTATQARETVAHAAGALIHCRQRNRVRAIRVVEHVRAIAGQRELEQRAGKGAARLDQGKEASRRQIDPLERSRDESHDLPHEPVIAMLGEHLVAREDIHRIAHGSNNNGPNLRLVESQSQNRIVQRSEGAERPVLVADLKDAFRRRRLRGLRRSDRELGKTTGRDRSVTSTTP